MVAVAFFNVDVQDLRLDRLVAREDLFIRILNLHLVLFFFFVFFAITTCPKAAMTASPFVLGLSNFGKYCDFGGRRSAALIPILVLGVFSITQQVQF